MTLPILVISLMLILLIAFLLFDKLIRLEYKFHKPSWEEDGRPASFFQWKQGSYIARSAVSLSWLFMTPDWMLNEPKALKLVKWYRVLAFLWLIALVYLAYLTSVAR